MGKIIIAGPGESRWSYRALAHDAHANVRADSDAEYIDGLIAKNKRLKQQPQKSYISQKFFYGAAPPNKPDFAEIKAALKVIDSPTLEELEGTIEGVRDKMRKYAQCPYCWLSYRGKTDYLQHIQSHPEVQNYLEFVDRATQDFDSLQFMQGELASMVDGDEKKLQEMDSRIARLRQQEQDKVDGLIEEDQIDHEKMQLIAGGIGYEDYVLVKPDAELTKLRERLQSLEGKAEVLKNELSRKRVRLEQVQKKKSRFERCADTANIAKGQKTGDNEVIAMLRESLINYSPESAATRKMIYVPDRHRGLTPFSNMRSD